MVSSSGFPMKGGGLVVGWGGCECDGLVSNTLSLPMSATSTHPTMVSHSPVCFKAIVLSTNLWASVSVLSIVSKEEVCATVQ